MGHRMRVVWALIYFMVSVTPTHTFIPGADGPVIAQEALEGGSTSLFCDASADPNDELMLLVWYKNNAPIYSFDARVRTEWSNPSYNTTSRLTADVNQQPTALTVNNLRGDDQALYHCRVDFLLAPTRNIGVNLTVIVPPSRPFFLDELGNKVGSKIGPYHEGDTLVLSCLVIGGRPPPKISWYSGDDLVDASDGESDIPGVKENELYLPLTRNNAQALSCRATNTDLTEPVISTLQIDLYLAAYNVSISWVRGTVEGTLQAGKQVVVKCVAHGSRPPPELSWWLDHRHLTQHSNQSWDNATGIASSHLQLTPAVGDHGATLACVATNTAMPPGRDSKADLTILNVTYSPVVEISMKGDGRLNQVSELDTLHLECEVKANPPVVKYKWFYNDIEIGENSLWGSSTSSATLVVEETTRELAGRYCCSALNGVGETRSDTLNITVLYPPECSEQGIKLVGETLQCIVRSLPPPDTFFWHVQPSDEEVQHLTSGSAYLPLSQITGSLATTLSASCEASNGIASQDKACQKIFHFESLRPPQPQQCDLAYEFEEFQMRCVPVENATYYEVSVWRLSTSNSSLMLERRGSMGYGTGRALARGGTPWLVRGALGSLGPGDEAGAAACNRYGCSPALLLRPTENLLDAASVPWWKFLTEKDFGISIGAVILVAVFILSTWLAVRLARRTRAKPPAPVIQLVHLDDASREYLDTLGEQKVRASNSLRSCSSGYSDGSMESVPTIDRRRKSRNNLWTFEPPPPDVTLTLSRESAV
ncbi:Fc receptor-like protein 5 isoform X1 [Aricia agestis]|uniref:Fc receptor-like protein 5 isoform X1 n=1 Tax=Aricia agestis TaxID=91739 RepID=UPI001C207E96|nr:Fc receptor-like protein 5 isoform X1 [Aricia agestis]XP_041969368.1 Fc receptor-like protein 5 isoform X1 [Aricia agestis]